MSTMTYRISKGFSIVEVLIIIAVIGILASIVLVSYNGIQGRAHDAAVQADLEGLAGILESYRVRPDAANPNSQFPSSEATLATLDIKASKKSYDEIINHNFTYCLAVTGTDAYQAYTLIAKSKSGKIFTMTEDGFTPNSITQSDITANLCTTLGMSHIAYGMEPAGIWKAWVHSG